MDRSVAKPLVIAVTGFATLVVFISWLIAGCEIGQFKHHEHRFGLPPIVQFVDAILHFSWLIPLAAGVIGARLLRHETPSATAISRYGAGFFLATCAWAVLIILTLFVLRPKFL